MPHRLILTRATGQLKTKAALDYETKNAYSVVITVSDSAFTATIKVTIIITDVDENHAPAFAGNRTTRSVKENTDAGVNIGSPVSATDDDEDTLTYTLGGTDATAFSIVSTTGQLKTSAPLDFETKNAYTVTITVSDGSRTDSITVAITIIDIDESSPTIDESPRPAQIQSVISISEIMYGSESSFFTPRTVDRITQHWSGHYQSGRMETDNTECRLTRIDWTGKYATITFQRLVSFPVTMHQEYGQMMSLWW